MTSYCKLHQYICLSISSPICVCLHAFITLFVLTSLTCHLVSLYTASLSNLRTQSRVISRGFLGTPLFEMVIFPYWHRGCLWVKTLRVFKTSDPIKTYSAESNTLVPHNTEQQNLRNLQITQNLNFKMGREGMIANLPLVSIVSTKWKLLSCFQ